MTNVTAIFASRLRLVSRFAWSPPGRLQLTLGSDTLEVYLKTLLLDVGEVAASVLALQEHLRVILLLGVGLNE